MNSIFKLIRSPNLLIIIATQYLLRHCLIITFYPLGRNSLGMSEFNFALLVLATLLIAIGGNIINDYFDVEIDKINKPDRNQIGQLISRHTAYRLYWIITAIGVIIGFYLGHTVNDISLGFVFLLVAVLLYYYSSELQKTILWGNIAVATLSAMVILIVWLFEFYSLKSNPIKYVDVMKRFNIISIMVGSYALFAFIMSLIREMIKDVEDVEGDKRAAFKTLVILKGVRVSSVFAMVLGGLCIILLGFCQYYLFTHGFSDVAWYLLIAVQSLLMYMLYLLFNAKTKSEYSFISNTAKIIMAAGILSMQLFCVSF